MPLFQVTNANGFTLSTDTARLNLALIHRWLSEESYWARHIPRATLRRALNAKR